MTASFLRAFAPTEIDNITGVEMPNTWVVGSNGNFFMDAGGDRYCVAHEVIGYKEDGRSIFKFSANRNGNQIRADLYDSAAEAKAACESRAREAA